MGEAALPRRNADALLVGAGLFADRRTALCRADTPGQRQDIRRNGFRQMGNDQRRWPPRWRSSSRILGGRMDWAEAFASWSPHELSGIPKAMQINLEVGPVSGQGLDHAGDPVRRSHARRRWRRQRSAVDLEARSVVNGVEHRVSPVCPHLGGIVNWNDADESWECPLHGSRFAPDGKLLEGPATRDLTGAQ